LVGFVILAFQAHEEGKKGESVLYGALALLFQPFFKIALCREIWNLVDVVVGIGLILSVLVTKKNR
jgi:hypothetical protein